MAASNRVINDLRTVAEAFRDNLREYDGYFREAVFAIPKGRGSYNHNVFKSVLSEFFELKELS